MRTLVVAEEPAGGERGEVVAAEVERGGRAHARPRRARPGTMAREAPRAAAAARRRSRARSGRAWTTALLRGVEARARRGPRRARARPPAAGRSARAAARPARARASSSNAATCPSAWTPASVRPAPATATRGPAREPGERLLERRPAPCGRRRALELPADEVGAVVGERDAVERHAASRQRAAREPGFSGCEPAAHSGQASAGVGLGTSSSSRLREGTPRSDARRRCGRRGCPTASTRAPRAAHGVHHLARRAAGRDHVLDHDHRLARARA